MIKYIHVIFILLILKFIVTQRRIKNGKEVESNKPYVVYFIKSPTSNQKYDAWLCGGAIVSPWYIVTSAACVEDVKHMYVIAGYRYYVTADKLNEDPCAKDKKKKIVFTCVPKAYEFDYARLDKWSYIDIAAVKVESAYNFNDESYKTSCSYIPAPIDINYEMKWQDAGTDAMVLGWGHADVWRKPEDKTNYNQQTLQYAATLIQDKAECKKSYAGVEKLDDVIDKYMICTSGAGNINAAGALILKSKPTADGCISSVQKMKGEKGVLCISHEENDEEPGEIVTLDGRRSNTTELNISHNQTRRNGICQNDHGGPLVTWIGSHEVLIGVASVFLVDKDSQCTGPYLFTSTQCNGAFLDCVINAQNHNESRRYNICKQPPKDKGYVTIEKEISWANHPDAYSDKITNSMI